MIHLFSYDWLKKSIKNNYFLFQDDWNPNKPLFSPIKESTKTPINDKKIEKIIKKNNISFNSKEKKLNEKRNYADVFNSNEKKKNEIKAKKQRIM